MEEWITAERITITSLLAGIIISGARKMWVWGYQVSDMETRRVIELEASNSRTKAAEDRANRWEGIALKALNVGERAVSTVERNGG